MQKNWTPGPWSVDYDTANDGTPWITIYQRISDGTHITIATMGCSDGEVWGGYVGEERDARIISAAPDLLGACKLALQKATHESSCSVGSPDYSDCDCYVSKLAAAISKAESE